MPSMGGAAPDCPRRWADLGEAFGVVGLGGDGLGQVAADLARGDVEGGDEIDVPDVVAAEIEVHEPGDGTGAGRVAVEFDALYKR